MTEFLLGFMTCAWLLTIGGVAYAIWRYVVAPWRVMRTDIAALNTKLDHAVLSFTRRQSDALSDEEIAFREERLLARSRARAREVGRATEVL